MRPSPSCKQGAARTREGDGVAVRRVAARCRRNRICSRGAGPWASLNLPSLGREVNRGSEVNLSSGLSRACGNTEQYAHRMARWPISSTYRQLGMQRSTMCAPKRRLRHEPTPSSPRQRPTLHRRKGGLALSSNTMDRGCRRREKPQCGKSGIRRGKGDRNASSFAEVTNSAGCVWLPVRVASQHSAPRLLRAALCCFVRQDWPRMRARLRWRIARHPDRVRMRVGLGRPRRDGLLRAVSRSIRLYWRRAGDRNRFRDENRISRNIPYPGRHLRGAFGQHRVRHHNCRPVRPSRGRCIGLNRAARHQDRGGNPNRFRCPDRRKRDCWSRGTDRKRLPRYRRCSGKRHCLSRDVLETAAFRGSRNVTLSGQTCLGARA